jgi:hypothetical protein
MDRDYYGILGVAENADIDSIRRAYRLKAMAVHPDRGGSHEEMLLAAEAWEVLSNPVSRHQYDLSRGIYANREAHEAADGASRRAREKAQQYPRSWPEFERWMAGVAQDFQQAKHSSAKGYHGWEWPVVENSISGWLFIIIGGILSLATLVVVLKPSQMAPVILLLFALPGAWFGAWLHKAISQMVRPVQHQQAAPSTEGTSTAGTMFITCRGCGQRLRLPSVGGDLRVTCPACKNQFDFP